MACGLAKSVKTIICYPFPEPSYELASMLFASFASRWLKAAAFLSDISASRRAEALSPDFANARPNRTR
jgi:hypothetical protein